MSHVFVGESRRRVVDALAAAFDDVTNGSGSRVAVLASPPGWGKTRIVQELYRHLAAGQSTPAYWPPAIVDEDVESGSGTYTLTSLSHARKAVYPTQVIVPPGAEMEWMWWGVLCQQRSHGQLAQAMFDDATQLYAHAEALMRDRPDAAGRAFDVGSVVVDVLGLLGLAVAPPVGAAIAIAGAAKVGWANRDVLDRMKEWWSRNRGEQESRTLSAHSPVHREDEIERLVEGLGRLTRARPMVVVVDDAHFADETLVRVVDGLVREGRGRVLVVATAWPSHLDTSAGALPFASWTQELGADGSGRYLRFDLDELTDADIEQVIGAELPAAKGLSRQMKELYGTNLLAIRAVLRLPRVRRLANAGDVDLNALANLPQDIEAAFAEHWAGLPDGVQHVLALAAQPRGTRYLPEVVAAACETHGIIESARERIAEGVSPYAWTREIDKSLHTFVEPVLDKIAKGRADELLTDDDVEGLYTAIVDAALRIEHTDLSPSAREELLEQHVALVENGSASKGAEAAESALALSSTYASRYAYTRAVDLARLAIDWTDLRFDHTRTLITRRTLARWLFEAGRVEEAVTTYEALLRDDERILGPDDPDTLRTRHNLASALRATGRVAEAVKMSEALLVDQERILGAEHPVTLHTRSNLAAALQESGRVEEAAPRYEALLADRQRILGRDHPDTLRTRGDLAYVLAASGRVDEAATMLETLLADLERVLGPDHPDTLRTRHNLAYAVWDSGRVQEAITRFEMLLADQERILGPDHPDTLRTRSNLAWALSESGRVEESATRLEALLADRQRILGPDHPDTLTARSRLASALRESGRANEAVTRFEALVADSERILGRDHPDTLAGRVQLAYALQASGRVDEAVTRGEAVVADSERILGPDHPDTLFARHNLAYALQASGRLGEAVTRYQALLADQERILGSDHPHTLVTRHNLADALQAAGRTSEAVTRFEGLLPDSERILGTDHGLTLATRHKLAAALYETGRVDEAVTSLEALLADRERMLGPNHADTMATRDKLISVSQAAGMRTSRVTKP